MDLNIIIGSTFSSATCFPITGICAGTGLGLVPSSSCAYHSFNSNTLKQMYSHSNVATQQVYIIHLLCSYIRVTIQCHTLSFSAGTVVSVPLLLLSSYRKDCQELHELHS